MKITFGMFLDGTQWSEKDSDFDKWVKQRQEDIADAFGSWVEELRKNPLEKSEQIPHARRLIPSCAEKKKNTEESKNVLKFQNEILDVSNERILQGIRLLTRPRSMDKALYLQKVAASGDLEALLVKISDRICNSKDFVQLKGAAFAHQYLHEADCLIAALEKFSDNSITQKAWQEWNDLDETLRREAQGNAGALK